MRPPSLQYAPIQGSRSTTHLSAPWYTSPLQWLYAIRLPSTWGHGVRAQSLPPVLDACARPHPPALDLTCPCLGLSRLYARTCEESASSCTHPHLESTLVLTRPCPVPAARARYHTFAPNAVVSLWCCLQSHASPALYKPVHTPLLFTLFLSILAFNYTCSWLRDTRVGSIILLHTLAPHYT